MICPVCKYEHKDLSYKEGAVSVKGAKGEFFAVRKPAKRQTYSHIHVVEKAYALGCPNCGVVFLDIKEEKEE